MYLGAHSARKVWAPIAFPIQYAINITLPITDFLVRPAILDGSNVHINNPGRRPVAVIR